MVRLLLSLAALAVVLVAPPAAQSQSNDSWISLAVESLQPTSRNARIDVSRTKGRSKAVRLAVRDGSIIIDRVVITYANGQVHFGDLEKPITLCSGQSSDPFSNT